MELSETAKKSGLATLYAVYPPGFWAYEISDKLNTDLKLAATKLEQEHKLLFAALSLANNTYIRLYQRFRPAFIKLKKEGIDYTKSYQYKKIVALGVDVIKKSKDWFSTQRYLEDHANIPKLGNIAPEDFLNPKQNIRLLKIAQSFFDKGVKGIGSPVVAIIWAAAVITAGISIAYIVGRVTVSTDDRIQLLEATGKACTDLKLSPAQCSDVLKTAQVEETKNYEGAVKETDAITSGTGNMLMKGLLVYFAYKLLTNKKTANV